MSVLSFTRFKELRLWDVKRYVSTHINSKYNVVHLEKCIIEQNNKIKPFEYPNDDFKILGVSNQKGLFDNYIEKGANIKQPYKKVENNYLAYNPYRINVGSIGLKTNKQKYDYISPAYVVFNCDNTLIAEYLFLIFKTGTFNTIIRDNTKGSVRQNLSFDILQSLQIPLPPKDISNDENIKTQKEILKAYNDKISQAEAMELEAKELTKSIEEYLYNELGIEHKAKEQKSSDTIMSFVRYKSIEDKWSVSDIQNSKADILYSSQSSVTMKKLKDIAIINPTVSFVKEPQNKEVSFIPMECVSDDYGEIMEHRDGITGESKGYKKFVENDIIWSRITPCMQNGKSAIATGLKNKLGYGSTEYHIVRIDDDTLREYIYHILRNDRVLQEATSYFTGSAGQQRVPKEFLENLKIPIVDKPKMKIYNQTLSIMKQKLKELNIKAKEYRENALKEFEKEIFSEA
jgi:type I restriction enzyme S subunit